MSTEHYQNLHLLQLTLQRKEKNQLLKILISVGKKLRHKTFYSLKRLFMLFTEIYLSSNYYLQLVLSLFSISVIG